MATQTINTVAGNTAPAWIITAKRKGVVIDVTGCSVDLILAKGNSVTNAGHQDCVIVTPTSGIVSYSPQTGDVPVRGKYKADLKVIYPDATSEILYDQLVVNARKALGT